MAIAHCYGHGGLWPHQAYFIVKFSWEEESHLDGERTCLHAQTKDKMR